MAFIENAQQIFTALSSEGFEHLKVVPSKDGNSKEVEILGNLYTFTFSTDYARVKDVFDVLIEKVSEINKIYKQLRAESPSRDLETHFAYKETFKKWNKQVKNFSELQIEVIEKIQVTTNLQGVSCFFETENLLPLILDLHDEQGEKVSFDHFQQWFRSNEVEIKTLYADMGALLFRGVEMLSTDFPVTFQLFCEKNPIPYPGIGQHPIIEELGNVYISTNFSESQLVPCHTECVMLNRVDSVDNVPKIVAFYCDVPADEGGETTLADLGSISRILEEEHPEIWSLLENGSLNYCLKMSTSPSFSQIFTELIDPTFQNVNSVFGTSNKDEIESRCSLMGLECDWSTEGELKVINRNAPTFLNSSDGSPKLYGSMMHLDAMERATQEDQIGYSIAKGIQRIFGKKSAISVEMADGTPIAEDISETILKVIQSQTTGAPWMNSGEVLFVDNHRVMHGKNPHVGDRNLYVAFA